MIYNAGDILICKEGINTGCLEMTNTNYDIMQGDYFIVTDTEKYDTCQWCELVPLKDTEIILNAWNDEGHMIIDDCFEKVVNPIDESLKNVIETVKKNMDIA